MSRKGSEPSRFSTSGQLQKIKKIAEGKLEEIILPPDQPQERKPRIGGTFISEIE
jgi:hypothetical protein